MCLANVACHAKPYSTAGRSLSHTAQHATRAALQSTPLCAPLVELQQRRGWPTLHPPSCRPLPQLLRRQLQQRPPRRRPAREASAVIRVADCVLGWYLATLLTGMLSLKASMWLAGACNCVAPSPTNPQPMPPFLPPRIVPTCLQRFTSGLQIAVCSHKLVLYGLQRRRERQLCSTCEQVLNLPAAVGWRVGGYRCRMRGRGCTSAKQHDSRA